MDYHIILLFFDWFSPTFRLHCRYDFQTIMCMAIGSRTYKNFETKHVYKYVFTYCLVYWYTLVRYRTLRTTVRRFVIRWKTHVLPCSVASKRRGWNYSSFLVTDLMGFRFVFRQCKFSHRSRRKKTNLSSFDAAARFHLPKNVNMH